MALPVVPIARSSVTIGSEVVEFRALSRAEAMVLNEYRGRENEAEVFIITAGTGCTEAEAIAFRQNNDIETAGLLSDAILVLSKLADKEADPKSPMKRR